MTCEYWQPLDKPVNMRLIHTHILLLVLALGIAIPGVSSAAKHSAVESIRKVAEQIGDPSAQYILGNMYARGNKVEKDTKQAIHWYTQAARQGHTSAQARLGILLMEGPAKYRHYEQALSYLKKAAKDDHPDALHHIGEMYRRGLGMKKDTELAFQWYLRAAKQQHPTAQYRLGKIFETGQGAKRDLVEARKWYQSAREIGSTAAKDALDTLANAPANTNHTTKKSDITPLEQNLAWAKAGDSSAMYRLGRIFGKGDQTDMKKSVYWYAEAANKGHADAQFELAQLYLQGSAVQKDKEEALIWLSMASIGGHEKARKQLALLEPQHERSEPAKPVVAKVDTTRPEVKPATTLADKARLGDTRAQYDLAMKLMADKSQADQVVYWLERAASADHALSKYQLANMFISGRLVKADSDRGMLLMEEAANQGVAAARTAITTLKSAGYEERRAAEQGDTTAQFELAQQYLASARSDDHKQAIDWLIKAAQGQHVGAMIHLGHLYMRGEYTNQNQQKAFTWYHKAAEHGEPEAQFQIAQMYSRGTGTSRSNAMAARWYRMAARQNHIRAQEKLGGCLVCD